MRAKLACESWVVFVLFAAAAIAGGVLLTGCDVDGSGLQVPSTDAGAAMDVGRDVGHEALPPDTAPPACIGTREVTLDQNCCDGCAGRPCWIGAGLGHYPCDFQGTWVVAACSQCWYLP